MPHQRSNPHLDRQQTQHACIATILVDLKVPGSVQASDACEFSGAISQRVQLDS